MLSEFCPNLTATAISCAVPGGRPADGGSDGFRLRKGTGVRFGRAGVGRRLGAAFSVLMALMIVAAGVGWWAMARQQQVQRELTDLQAVQQDVKLAEYQMADISGW